MKNILKFIGTILLIIIIGVFILLKIIEYRGNHYYNYLETEKELEKKYSQLGEYKVSFKSFEADNDVFKKYEIWYPTDLENSNEKYPLVVVANGTGTPASKYKAFFKHLASWGFVVIGNLAYLYAGLYRGKLSFLLASYFV